jgi:trk system potassium uptake protein
MKVVICGAGQVGFGIAERLANERNDVAVVDRDERLLQSMADQLDVRTVLGHGSHPDVLARAGLADADMLIAVTHVDEVNMVACQLAHSLFNVPSKVARVRAQTYLAPEYAALYSRDNLPIDVVISPEIEVGETVLRRLGMRGAIEAVPFADGEVMFLGIPCEDQCPILETPLRQLTGLFPDLKSVVVGVQRGADLLVPTGEERLRAGDLAFVCAPKDQVGRTLALFGRENMPPRRLVIAGGGQIGLYVAQEIERRTPTISVTLIESSRERAQHVAQSLKHAVVLHGSALDQGILREADIGNADLMIALTNDDQVNVLSSVMAKSLGAKQNLCLVNNRSYPQFVRGLGIDAYLDPRAITISRILQHVRRGRIRNVHALLEGAAEVIETEAPDSSPLIGRPLRELRELRGVRIGAILRNGKVLFPAGDQLIVPNDRVVLFALRSTEKQIEQLFRVSLEFF